MKMKQLRSETVITGNLYNVEEYPETGLYISKTNDTDNGSLIFINKEDGVYWYFGLLPLAKGRRFIDFLDSVQLLNTEDEEKDTVPDNFDDDWKGTPGVRIPTEETGPVHVITLPEPKPVQLSADELIKLIASVQAPVKSLELLSK